MKKRKILFNIILISILIIIIFISIFIILYVNIKYNKKNNNIINQLENVYSDKIIIEKKNDVIIKPIEYSSKKGLILYTEKNVDNTAYVPLCIPLAEKGHLIIILNYNFYSNKVQNIINYYNDIKSWVIGGHGAGGKYASKLLGINSKIKGIFFLASYPDESLKFLNKELKVYSIIGDSDDLLNIETWMKKNNKLPESTVYTIIENGNHSYFANYKMEKTNITKDQQQLQTFVQLNNLLDELN